MSETCYGHSSPNAVILPNYGPCNPQAGSISLCCENSQTCLTNGLCVTKSGVYYSGGCTDSTYKAAICPTFCTSGDANWVVECHGPAIGAVQNGDFCCSVNGTTTTCCNTASNGLGLVAAVSSTQAMSATSVGANTAPASVSASIVPTSVSISTIPTSISSGTITSSGSNAASLPSTPLPPATSQFRGSTGMPRSEKVEIGVIVPIAALALLCTILYVRRWIKRRLERRRLGGSVVALNDRRGGTDKSGSQAPPIAEGVVPAEVEGSPVGPVEMDANQTAVPTGPPPSGIAAPEVAPDNNPLCEPSATPGSWYAPNLGNL